MFIHEYKKNNKMNEEHTLEEEFLRDGPKGISFHVTKLSKGKKSNYFKVGGKELEDGTYGITIKKGEEVEKKTIANLKDLIAFSKQHSELAFLNKYLTKDMEKFRKTLKGGKRKSTKKGSKAKKTTKKSTKKGSKAKKTTKPKKATKKTTKPKKGSKKKTSKKSKKY
jgi:hypothetical protein